MTAAYVALGDSYSAGVGAGDREDACYRSPLGYPVLLSAQLGLDLSYRACQGAVIDDVRAHQVDALGPETELVTITVGGNDAGFGPVLTAAAAPSWFADSAAAMDAAESFIERKLGPALSSLYADIVDRAPAAEFVVLGYPRLFAGIDCNLSTFFSEDEMIRLNAIADLMAETIGEVAQKAGAIYLDVRDDFETHEVCRPASWLHGLTWPIEESFHPKRSGHAAYARILAEEVELSPRQPGAPPAVEYGPCVPGSAPPFGLTALGSASSLAAAEAAGLDPVEITDLADRLDRFQRPPTSPHPAAVTPREWAARARLDDLHARVQASGGRSL